MGGCCPHGPGGARAAAGSRSARWRRTTRQLPRWRNAPADQARVLRLQTQPEGRIGIILRPGRTMPQGIRLAQNWTFGGRSPRRPIQLSAAPSRRSGAAAPYQPVTVSNPAPTSTTRASPPFCADDSHQVVSLPCVQNRMVCVLSRATFHEETPGTAEAHDALSVSRHLHLSDRQNVVDVGAVGVGAVQSAGSAG